MRLGRFRLGRNGGGPGGVGLFGGGGGRGAGRWIRGGLWGAVVWWWCRVSTVSYSTVLYRVDYC